MNPNRYSLFIILLIGALIWQCAKKETSPEVVLATVGSQTITENDFIPVFQRLKQKGSFQDNGQTRRQILAQLVRQKLFLMEAQQRGYTSDEIAQFERDRLQVQGLLNEYYTREIAGKVSVSEADLKEYFIRFHTRIKARHLYAPTRTKADSLYNLLQSGKSFVELAQQVFTDPVLRQNGGLVGYFTVDEMHPNFEDAAFHMKKGEISPPVKIAGGYSIIKVEDKIVNPLLTESEYLRKKEQLRRYVIYRKRQQAAARFVAEKRQELRVQVNPQTLHKLFSQLQASQHRGNLTVFRNEGAGFPPELLTAPLVSFEGGEWTVATFLKKARFTSAKEWQWVRYPENLEEFIAGLVVRDFMLMEARKKHLDDTPTYHQYVTDHWQDFVLQRLEDSIQASIEVPEDSIAAYYKQFQDKFVTPPRVCLSEIVVTTPGDARKVQQLLKQGADFATLAREYSQRTVSAQRGGYLGCFTRQQLQAMGDAFFSQPQGSWVGPIQQKSMFVFFKIDRKLPREVQPLETVREDIVAAYRYMKLDAALQDLENRLRQEIPVTVHWERLRTIQLKRGE